MRNVLPPVLFSLFLVILLSLRTKDREVIALRPDISAIGCMPPLNTRDMRPDEQGRFAPVFPGWGQYSYKVRTNSDSAQLFFDQGLNMYYSYHLREALASFKEAARRDSDCVMAYWGQALAMGPYYNNYVYKMPAAVLPVVAHMNRLAASAAGKEKDLVDAMNKRYASDTSDSRRKDLNRAYSEGMKALITKFPADADIKALYIDAVMLEHSWDFWSPDGQPKTWTPELVAYCEQILKVHPLHPAGLHYQIHLVEASLHPEAALHSADVLQAAMPGVGHMVHMSSHMYQRNGLYAKGEEVNERANDANNHYDSMATNLKLGHNTLVHVYAVQTFCAMNAAMYKKSMHAASRCRTSILDNNKAILYRTEVQYNYMMPMFALARLGKWQEIIDGPQPDSSLPYAVMLDCFGRGLAELRLGNMTGARNYLGKMRLLVSQNDSLLRKRNMPFNAPMESLIIAQNILTGELSLAQGRNEEAIRDLEQAVVWEDGMIYREPREWPLPARHFLGAALLKLNRAAEAEKVYRQDLALNPANGWSLLGLYQSLQAQHKKEVELYEKKYKVAFAAAEEMPTSSAF